MALKFAAGGALAGVAAYGLYQLNQPKKDQLKMIISGGPGSGKGTQCELLVNKYGLKHISTGDALRHHVKTGTDLGREAKAYMERGDLVPDSLVIGICKAEMETSEAKNNGWLLDGMPRTKAQCDALEDMGLVPNLFLRLDVPDEVMMDRACGRRQNEIMSVTRRAASPPGAGPRPGTTQCNISPRKHTARFGATGTKAAASRQRISTSPEHCVVTSVGPPRRASDR